MSHDWTRAEQQHAHVTETHPRTGKGGRGWGVETKPGTLKRPKEGRQEMKYIRKEQNACS